MSYSNGVIVASLFCCCFIGMETTLPKNCIGTLRNGTRQHNKYDLNCRIKMLIEFFRAYRGIFQRDEAGILELVSNGRQRVQLLQFELL